VNMGRVFWLLKTRWYLAAAVAVLLAGAFAAAFATYPPQYQSKAILVVTTPANGGRIAADPRTGNDITNPLFNFQGGQNIAAAILIASAESPSAQQRIGTSSQRTSYTVTDGSTNPEIPSSGPFIYVDATGPTGKAALATSNSVVDFIRSDLLNRQIALGPPRETFLSVVDVVAPTPPIEQRGNQYAAGTVAAIVCLLLSVVVVDRVDRRSGRELDDREASQDSESRPSPSPRRNKMSRNIDAETETIVPVENSSRNGPSSSGVGRR
jgi:hypothetical protein